MTYTTNHVDTLLVNGTDLQSLVEVTDLSGLFAPGTRRGSNDVIPGQRGQVGAPKVWDAYSFQIPILIDGGTSTDPLVRRAQMVANLRTLMTAVSGTNGGLVALTRRLAKVGGGYDTHTCAGEFAGLNSLALLNFDTGQTDMEFINLDGAWLNGTNWLVP